MQHVAFDARDIQRLQHAVDYAHHASESSLDNLLPPWIPGGLKREIRFRCIVSHCATLLFPQTADSALDHFEEKGWSASAIIPSVLVKRRLVERHGLPDDVEVWVTRLRVTPAPGPEVEVFLFPATSPGYRDEVGAQERAHGFENHVGLFLETPDEDVIGGLIDGLESAGQFLFEGSAHNPHENTTMFYFAPNARVAGDRRRFPRWELQCPGDLSALAARRPVRGAELRLAYARLMANRPAEHVPSVVLTTPRHVTPAH